jgi:hypothetical protein
VHDYIHVSYMYFHQISFTLFPDGILVCARSYAIVVDNTVDFSEETDERANKAKFIYVTM